MAIDRIEIENLRGIKQGAVEGFSPLSILVGPNNCGKSTVLEAVFCVGKCTDAGAVFQTLLRRGGSVSHGLQYIFFQGVSHEAMVRASSPDGISFQVDLAMWLRIPTNARRANVEEIIDIKGLQEPVHTVILKTQNQQGNSFRASHLVDANGKWISWQREGQLRSWPCSFVDVEAVRAAGALEDAYSRLEQNRGVELVIKALKRAMPTLTDLRILKADKDFILHTIHGSEKPIPAYLAGDGFKRFLEIASHIVSNKNEGIVLLEEPESFQHPRYLGELAMLLKETASRGTQVILSTHSLELIQLLLAESPEYPSTLFPTVHRLRLHEGVLHATALSAEIARYNMNELEQDLRA